MFSVGADIHEGRRFHSQVRLAHPAESTRRDGGSPRQHHRRGVQGAASDRLLSADRHDPAQVQHHGNCRVSQRRRCQQRMWQDLHQRQPVALCQGLSRIWFCCILLGVRCRCVVLSVWNEVQIVCIWSIWCHCIPKPHHLLPHLNPDWFLYLSGTGLPKLSQKRGR